MISKRHLTEHEKEQIYKAINKDLKEDDRDITEVIKERYGGDEEKYLIKMARYLGIKWINALNLEQIQSKSIQRNQKVVELKSKKVPFSKSRSIKNKADVF